MAGIGDWFADREHRTDRDPSYDPFNDEQPDRAGYGELPSARDESRWASSRKG